MYYVHNEKNPNNQNNQKEKHNRDITIDYIKNNNNNYVLFKHIMSI